MKFTLSTKPLSDALALGVVNANISKFYRKSCLAQVTASKSDLIINLEASFILSEIRLKGSGDAETTETIFVDSLLLKQLVSTFDTSTVTLEFTEGGLILYSGKSKFTLPKMVDGDELSLNTPSIPGESANAIKVDKADWKFIKDYQMYAIAMSFIHPVYTRVWVGSNGDVLVGDFDNSIFTHSEKNKLGDTCLLSDTVINLFNSLPEGAELYKSEKSYMIKVATDGFEFIAEFTPQYESDEGVGSYHSEMILDMVEKPAEGSIKLSTAAINKFLSQAELLKSSAEDVITLYVNDNNQIGLKDSNVDCIIDVEGKISEPFKVNFKTSLLKSVFSNYTDESIKLAPMISEDEVVGVLVWNKELTTVLAGVD